VWRSNHESGVLHLVVGILMIEHPERAAAALTYSIVSGNRKQNQVQV